MELKRIYIASPPASALGAPVPVGTTGTVPLNRKWLIREILVVHHGTSGLAPAGYVTVSARPAGFAMSLAQWQANSLMWANGPHWPLSAPSSYKMMVTLYPNEELATAQFHRTIAGSLVDGENALGGCNLVISALEVHA